MKYLLNTIYCFLIIGCASHKFEKSKHPNPAIKKIPNWVYNIDESCREELEICASAEGVDSISSDLNAKKALASIFETKIKSNFTLERFGFTNVEAEALSERVQDNVSESVDVILKGVEILKRFSKDDLYFSLAILDKVKARKALFLEIGAIDDQLEFLLEKSQKSSLIKMHVLLNKRILLNEKYSIVTGKSVPTDITYSRINRIKYLKSNGNRVLIKAINNVPRTILKGVESIITEIGYRVVKEEKNNYLVRLKYIIKEEYLNVEGFKKFSFSLTVEAKENTGDKLGTYTSVNIALGRNKQDAFLKVKNKLINDIRNNIEKLNIN